MDAGITPDMVDRKGIEDITVADIKTAAAKGKVIKLLCKGIRLADGTVQASVQPTEIDRSDMLASVNSTTSVVSITTNLMKKVSVVEHEPEIEQTAYGVFGDVLRVLEGR
jgi:homoserine dehydrogenase